jgi:hypothetical protein
MLTEVATDEAYQRIERLRARAEAGITKAIAGNGLTAHEVEGDPEEILARSGESLNAGQVTSSPALDPVFSGHFYEAIGEKVVKR